MASGYQKLSSFQETKTGNRDTLITMMQTMKTRKLSLRDILDIGQENITEVVPQTSQDLPWALLRKLMALDKTARNTCFVSNAENAGSNLGTGICSFDADNEFNPLDLLYVLLNSSDNFLKQNIYSKMSMCQFAVPLLLPDDDGSGCTFMLWAMRDIGKRWRPQSLSHSKDFLEENLVEIPMALFSFVRLGECIISKSNILNHVLSPSEQYNDFFIHKNMEGGNIERKISNGLVETSWYFPASGREHFEEPIAVANLRGDLESNSTQFCFLAKVSTAVFIFMDSINEEQFKLFSGCRNSLATFYFIINPSNGKNVTKETEACLEKLLLFLNIDTRNILIKDQRVNDARFVKTLQSILKNFLDNACRKTKLETMAQTANEFGIKVDENWKECQKGKECATEITKKIKNVLQYKKDNMKLQGKLWKQVSLIEKELCRMREQGDLSIEEYRSQLLKQRKKLHRQQNQHGLTNDMNSFISAITEMSQTEKRYFLKWMQFMLDSIGRKHISKLQTQYKETCALAMDNREKLKKLDQQISDSSLGVEHFLREIGQFYEAECSMVREEQIPKEQRQFSELPKIASTLLLDGFPLELIDGDASNIPLQWITDVLDDLDNKTGGKCRMRVISVLGVQSTGKSTLLNTMFGLQFPVASGRCTRGGFMTLIKVKESFQDKIGCELILVIDTEGLKAPELASLTFSNEHDNELATLVVGLSDITIINIAMENATEMKDTLQIVVHAFLRMTEIGKKPKCQFVHQNVSDVSAHALNMRDRKKLLEQLDEMTKVAANMEKRGAIRYFSDIIDYDTERDNWYIPGLWYGVPPMASVSAGYSKNIQGVKNSLFMEENSTRPAQKIGEFIEWLRSLWNAVKHENFIFSFRNSLAAAAYDQLSIKYSQWEWNFRREVYNWLISSGNTIKNQWQQNILEETSASLKDDLLTVLNKEESEMLKLLDKIYEDKSDNTHLIEKFHKDFITSVRSLRGKLEHSAIAKMDEAVRIQKVKNNIKSIVSNNQKIIESNLTSLSLQLRTQDCHLKIEEVESRFEATWDKSLEELPRHQVERRIIQTEMLNELSRNIANKGSSVQQKFLSVQCLEDFGRHEFRVEDAHIDINWHSVQGIKERMTNDIQNKINALASSLIQYCFDYIAQKAETGENYDETYCQELLNIINKRLREEEVQPTPFTHLFELDIKLHILGKAAETFQDMHDKFVQSNDPMLYLEKLKPIYSTTIKHIFQEKDKGHNRAEQFCEICLKPAITDHINQYLGRDIVDDILYRAGNKYCSRTFFQFTALKKLFHEENISQFVTYINSYDQFVKSWIKQNILDAYENPSNLKELQRNALSHICSDIRAVLHSNLSNSPTLPDFLEGFCKALGSKLIISQNETKVVIFQNQSDVQKFSEGIESFLATIENQTLPYFQAFDITSLLSQVTLDPQDELFKKVFGCGKQCPFCKVPCEAGGTDHKKHFASVHRPQGLNRWRHSENRKLTVDICSTAVSSDHTFRNPVTDWKWHPYKQYRTFYPDWDIKPDPSITASDYWKYIFAKFNTAFAKEYNALPADLPDSWNNITDKQALDSLEEIFAMKKC